MSSVNGRRESFARRAESLVEQVSFVVLIYKNYLVEGILF